jgi:hypothetical protein
MKDEKKKQRRKRREEKGRVQQAKVTVTPQR